MLRDSKSRTSEQRTCLWVRLSSSLPQCAHCGESDLAARYLRSWVHCPSTPPTAGRLAPAHSTVGCATRRTRAQRQLHGQGLRSLRAKRRDAIATPVPPAQKNMHAVRADPPRLHDATVVHAPRKGSCSRTVHYNRSNCAERSFDGGPWPRSVALLVLRSLDAFRQWPAAATPQRVRECDHGRQGVENRVQLISCSNQHPPDTSPVQPLRQAGCHLGPWLLQLRLLEPSDCNANSCAAEPMTCHGSFFSCSFFVRIVSRRRDSGSIVWPAILCFSISSGHRRFVSRGACECSKRGTEFAS